MDKLENKGEEQSEINRKKLVEKTIEKWLLLQKTIKEEITLEDIIKKQQDNDTKKLENNFKEYYTFKIKSRKTFEDMAHFKTNENSEESKESKESKEDKESNEPKDSLESKDKPNIKEFVIGENVDKVLDNSCEAVMNLLFTFRNNYDYAIQLLSLIEDDDDKGKIESLVELFCNQFYCNILIPNPEQEELLILIYKLLEKEIFQMNSASIDDFLHDSTFLGKFISSFSKNQELNIFLTILLNPIIESIENEIEECLDISLLSIRRYVAKMGMKKEILGENYLFTGIPKTKIHFKKSLQIEKEKEEENKMTKYNLESSQVKEENNLDSNNNNNIKKDEKIDYNEEYLDLLTEEKLIYKIKEAKDKKDIKEFYEYQLEQMNNETYLFSNKGLKEILNEPSFQKYRNQIMIKYKQNFLFIQKKVDEIIQSLIDKINLIPYPVRCICKLIFFLISKRFPLLSKYLRNSFIGKFIFNKCIFPFLSLENKNAVENNIFSINTKKCLYVIINVLSSAYKCLLFNYKTDTEKTIFNYYLLDIIPIINEFYEKLIDIELPKTLNDLVSQTKFRNEDNKYNKFFNLKKKSTNSKENNTSYTPTPLYDYFRENSDEIIKIQSICFSIYDIIYIFELIDKEENKLKFQGFTNYEKFLKEIDILNKNMHKLNGQLEKETIQRKFYVIFKEEKNFQLSQLFNKKKIDEKKYSEKDLALLKIKDCIKKILIGLNILNIKDYSYLNMATSNEKFLHAIQYTLEDMEIISEIEKKVPLNWYGQFLMNNLKYLDFSYLENDFEKLYEELYNEETIKLNELNSYSSIINTRDGMNLSCAEKILEKTRGEYFRLLNSKQLQKIENFIENDETKICIEIREPKEKIGLKEKNEPHNYINIVDQSKCHHTGIVFMAGVEGEKKIFCTHLDKINKFISKFDKNKISKEKIIDMKDLKTMLKFIEEDIKLGEPKHQLNNALNEYMQLLKGKLKNSNIYLENTENTNLNESLNKFTNKIRDYITQKIYKYVYPLAPLPQDKEFYYKTKSLDWITPESFDIPKSTQNQLGLAIYWIRKMDTEKSISNKIKCILNAQTNIANILKFTSGKDKEPGSDETTPIFTYAILKAQPKRIFSNLNYIKCFLDNDSSQSRFILTQVEAYITHIMEINYKTLGITKEEFDNKVAQSMKRNNLIK